MGEYDIPEPEKEDDTFLGWTQLYPVADGLTVNLLTEQSRWWNDSTITVNLYGVWGSDYDKLSTTETLSMIPNYYLNRNNIGNIYNYSNDITDKVDLDCTEFSSDDELNADQLLQKIKDVWQIESKICIVPKEYTLNIKQAEEKGYYVICSGLETEELTRALTLINCKYFQYLFVIQTPYRSTEEELNSEDGVGYDMNVTYWEIKDPDTFSGLVYALDTSKFKEYYEICERVDILANTLLNDVFKFNTDTTVVDAVIAINEYLIKYTAYDQLKQIYDLKWFLEKTSPDRNQEKEAEHHGVCASYSKLAYAILGKCGYETLPCATWQSMDSFLKGESPVHSINKVVIGNHDYYCDFTWADKESPMRYMFLSLDEVNKFVSHYGPLPDDYGTIINIGGRQLLKKDENMNITIIFNANGGIEDDKVFETSANEILKNMPTFTREGYILKGWYTQKTGGERITFPKKITCDLTLYAQWSKVTVKRCVINSAKAKKNKAITVKYKKIKGADGYQIQYSTSHKFKNKITKSVMINGNNSSSKKLEKLKRKIYYIRIRAYKLDSTGDKIYGKWSKRKKVAVK